MGSLKGPLPQGKHRHCGKAEQHDKHPNCTDALTGEPVTEGSWCDGVTPLDPFVELSIRVPVREFFGNEAGTTDHKYVLRLLADNGLGIIVDEMDRAAATVLRVRTGDGVDRVYPVKRGVPEGQGKLW